MVRLRLFLSHRLLWLAVLVSLGIGVLFARTIWTMRGDKWSYAQQTNTNLVRTLEKGLVWTLDSFDKSLAGVAREASRPEVWALPPDLRAPVITWNPVMSPAGFVIYDGATFPQWQDSGLIGGLYSVYKSRKDGKGAQS